MTSHTLLAFHAHPDDEALLTSGTMARAAAQGHRVVLVVATDGDLGLAVLCKTLYLSKLRLVYQQHMQLGLAKRGLVHTLRYRALDAWLAPLPGLAQQVLANTRLAARKLHAHEAVFRTPFPAEMAAWRPDPPNAVRDDALDALAGCLLAEPVRLPFVAAAARTAGWRGG